MYVKLLALVQFGVEPFEEELVPVVYDQHHVHIPYDKFGILVQQFMHDSNFILHIHLDTENTQSGTSNISSNVIYSFTSKYT